MKSMNTGIFTLFILASLFLLTACSKDKQTIKDNQWQVISLKNDSDTTLEVPSNTYVLKFEKKSFSIFLDVNSCGGDVSFSGSKINFSQAYCTEACCDTDFAMKIMDILSEVKRYELSESNLTFFTGKSGLINLSRVP